MLEPIQAIQSLLGKRNDNDDKLGDPVTQEEIDFAIEIVVPLLRRYTVTHVYPQSCSGIGITLSSVESNKEYYIEVNIY